MKTRNHGRSWRNGVGWLVILWGLIATVSVCKAQDLSQRSEEKAAPMPAVRQLTGSVATDWHYGAYVDVGYIGNFNFPDNQLWRNRATASHHNQLSPNMGLAYVRKDAKESSRWGMELGFQGGRDSEEFAFLVGERRVDGSDVLRHIHRANMSYLAPVGNGLTITAGLFNSLMGYESLYAKDNANYTRSWIADNTPYMMFGVNAQYPVSDDLTVTAFVVNSYYHLAHPNDLPSYGGRWIWKATPRLTLTQTLYGGPDQTQTSLEFWRLYGNHILEWKGDDVTGGGVLRYWNREHCRSAWQPTNLCHGRQHGREVAYHRPLVRGVAARVLLGSERSVDRCGAVREGDHFYGRVQASI